MYFLFPITSLNTNPVIKFSGDPAQGLLKHWPQGWPRQSLPEDRTQESRHRLPYDWCTGKLYCPNWGHFQYHSNKIIPRLPTRDSWFWSTTFWPRERYRISSATTRCDLATATRNVQFEFIMMYTVCHKNIAPNFQMKKVRFFLRSIFLKIYMPVPMTSITAYIK